MDLDKLKKTWQSAEIQPSINEDEIQQILNIRGQHAFNNIQQYEQRAFIASIVLICFGAIMIVQSHVTLDAVSIIIPIFITISSVSLLIWSIYKKHFFKKIDISRMSIISVSKAVNQYKKYLAVEGVVAFIWTITFAVIFISTNMLELNIIEQIILGISFCIFCSIMSYLGYRLTIKKNLKTINRAIEETEEFEKDNIE